MGTLQLRGIYRITDKGKDEFAVCVEDNDGKFWFKSVFFDRVEKPNNFNTLDDNAVIYQLAYSRIDEYTPVLTEPETDKTE